MKKLLFLFFFLSAFNVIGQTFIITSRGLKPSYLLAGAALTSATATFIYDYTNEPGKSTAIGLATGLAISYVLCMTSWKDATPNNKTLLYFGVLSGGVFIRGYIDWKSKRIIFEKPRQIRQYVAPPIEK